MASPPNGRRPVADCTRSADGDSAAEFKGRRPERRGAADSARDLVTGEPMDGWLGGKRSAEQELAAEARRERRRERLGEDVLVETGGAGPRGSA